MVPEATEYHFCSFSVVRPLTSQPRSKEGTSFGKRIKNVVTMFLNHHRLLLCKLTCLSLTPITWVPNCLSDDNPRRSKRAKERGEEIGQGVDTLIIMTVTHLRQSSQVTCPKPQ
jgi:hypothetical protein